MDFLKRHSFCGIDFKWRDRNYSGFSKNILIYVSKMKSFGLEATCGWANDKWFLGELFVTFLCFLQVGEIWSVGSLSSNCHCKPFKPTGEPFCWKCCWLGKIHCISFFKMCAYGYICPLQNDDDPEIPMDSVEMPHLRQRSFLQSQPVRRTPILHNFLHILTSRNSVPQAGGTLAASSDEASDSSGRYAVLRDRSRLQYHGCVQPLGVACFCSRCSSTRDPSPPDEDPSDSASLEGQSHASTFLLHAQSHEYHGFPLNLMLQIGPQHLAACMVAGTTCGTFLLALGGGEWLEWHPSHLSGSNHQAGKMEAVSLGQIG